MIDRAKILIIEDNDEFRKALCASLRNEFNVDELKDAESALLYLAKSHCDLVIVDVGLPGMDGHKFCASVRAINSSHRVPIIILSGRLEVEEKLVGFSLGADDYTTKPVDPRELKARIQLQLQRSNARRDDGQRFEVGPFLGDLLRLSISYSVAGERVEIHPSTQEFKLLHFFLTHIDHVLSRDQLLDRVWGSERHVSDRSVDALISKVRRKIGPYANLLEAVQGAGYRFRDPTSLETESSSLKKAE